ncbi:OLC1v1020228C1 [Oldenlandia corymbosa var. corymbosa]|uniref:OLC1v1020228C1 n=1 Tax=Oldenlandia corymbosa var. corymbosa TaxID=529605 RepID=A0AAV1EG03_OLDCO|nr:OLC1v1020228C1 [Oldenlandia corymbosa var. corymbosa]
MKLPFVDQHDDDDKGSNSRDGGQPKMVIRERIFHFSSESVAKLKAKANAECCGGMMRSISSLQALSAHIWRSVSCGELLEKSLGWAALLLHEVVNSKTDKTARDYIESWRAPASLVARLGLSTDASNTSSGILLAGSPRFNMYGVEFGLGKALPIRSGIGNKFDGKITVNPGIEGGGSMDLEICLAPHMFKSNRTDTEIAPPPTYDKLFPEGISPLLKLTFVDQHYDDQNSQ